MNIQVMQQEISSKTERAAKRKKYRIAVFHNIPSGGARRAIYDYMKALREDGHAFDVFDYSTSNTGVLQLDQFAQKMFHTDFDGNAECQIRLPFISGYVGAVRKIRKLGKLKAIGKRIAERIDEGGYDLAFIHHCSVTQAPYVLRYLRTPSVFYSGDPPRGLYECPLPRDYKYERRPILLRLRDAWYKPSNYLANGTYDYLLKRIYERNMENVDVLMANSYYSHETFYKLHGISAHVIHPGIDTGEFMPLGMRKENIVLSIGGIEPIKGHDFIIKSLANVDRPVRPELHIVANRGYGVEEKYLTSLAENLDVGIVIERNVSAKNLVELYNRAKLTLCGAVLEPFGLTPLESMACETPVIAVREGGFRESVAHGTAGYLVDRDHRRFGRCVEELLVDDDLRNDLGKNARRHVMKYWTVERVKKQLLELFEYTIDRHAKRIS